MMKAMWNTVSVLAVLHVAAVLLLAGWLWSSGRLNAARVRDVREMLWKTLADEQAEAAAARAEVEGAQREAEAEAERNSPTVQSAEQIRLMNMIEDRELMALRRLTDEKAMLLGQLGAAEDAVKKRDEALASERKAWEETTAADRSRQADEQFRKTVRVYESAPAKQAKGMLEELIRQGQGSQAVAYLDAMNPRAVTKVLKEFKTEGEIQMATKLLEDLRRFGTVPGATQETRNAADDQPTGS